jgi:hypothetical protein
MRIDVDWSSSFKPDKLDADMLKRNASAMVKIVTKIRAKAQQRLKVRLVKGSGMGGRFMGRLAESIVPTVAVTPLMIEGKVTVGVPYGKYVEGWNSDNQHIPVRRHYVPFSVAPLLKVWAQRKGLFDRFVKTHGGKGLALRKWSLSPNAKGMVVGGPDSITPFLQPTFLEVLPYARQLLGESMTGEVSSG